MTKYYLQGDRAMNKNIYKLSVLAAIVGVLASCEIHFGPIADQADMNQLKTKLQKTINGQPVIVYTYKNQ